VRETIHTYLEGNVSRKALLAVGGYIAGTYFGYVNPAGLEMMHEALTMALQTSPFSDPVSTVSSLFEGAQYHAASTLHTVGEWLEGVGVEIGHQARSAVNEARDFIGPGLDRARDFFMENAGHTSEAAARIRDTIRNAASSVEDAVKAGGDLISSGFSILRTAAEAYGIYEAGKAVYTKLFGEGKDAVEEASAPDDEKTERSVNLNVNISVAGGPAADAAKAGSGKDETAVHDLVEGMSGDRIIEGSEKLSRRITTDLEDVLSDEATVAGKGFRSSPPSPVMKTSSPETSHRDSFPMINWDQSPVSAQRLESFKARTARGGAIAPASLPEGRAEEKHIDVMLNM
jgi:hypothetical protein